MERREKIGKLAIEIGCNLIFIKGDYQGLQKLQTWLREVHKIDVTPEYHGEINGVLHYVISIYSEIEMTDANGDYSDQYFPYFEALEIGIYEALVLLKLNAVK